ncbi:MAG: hypothetical protein WB767_10280 [Nocardioides sp.]
MLFVVVLLAAGLLTWRLAGGDDTYRAAPPSSEVGTARPVQAAATLRGLERAIATNDVAAAEALADDPSRGAVAALVSNAAAADLDDVTFRYVDALTEPNASGVWSASVVVTWRFAGFDEVPSSAEVLFEFVNRPDSRSDEVLMSGVGGGDLRSPLWMDGPLEVQRGTGFVVTAPDAVDARRYGQLARRAVGIVRRVLTDWQPQLVVEVAANGVALERALDADAGYYGQIAAVTGSGDGSIADGSPIHVFVNPDVMNALGSTGQQVVLSHEATHVATDAPRSQAPTWLVEGFADYVALRGTKLPPSLTAAQIRDQVRRDGLPAALPAPGAFDTRTTHLGATYESAWRVCVVIDSLAGSRALVALYARLNRGDPLDSALRDEVGVTERELVRAWRADLSALP